jgi:alanine racemase
MRNTAFAHIDLSAIRHNLSVVRSLCPDSRVMAMVKADAYGHGLLQVAGALHEADGLAVARLEEALALRSAGVTQRILLLATLLDVEDLGVCSALHIDVTAHDAHSVAAITACGQLKLRVWLKLDSGMHRLGLDAAAFVAADHQLSNLSGVIEVIHMTHFSDSEVQDFDKTDRQVKCFNECHGRSYNRSAKTSLANSAAILTRPQTRTNWVRPGIMLYGCNPLAGNQAGLRAAMTLQAHIVAIRDLAIREPVGYNEQWVSERPSRIATVGIGYGDGYPRHAPNGTPVLLGGVSVPLVGRVSMDTITVDITDCSEACVGDRVELWGAKLPAAAVAACAGTISYALLAGLGQRVTRKFENFGSPIGAT